MEIVPVITPITIAATGVAQAAAASETWKRGWSLRVPTTNTSDVSISFDGVNYLTIYKGTEWGPKSLETLGFGKYNLASLLIKGTINDTCTLVAYE